MPLCNLPLKGKTIPYFFVLSHLVREGAESNTLITTMLKEFVMKAVEISQPGGPEVLMLVERPMPEPGAGQVLIKIHAAGVNRPDVMQRKGIYPPPPGASDLPGLEVAGEIAGGDLDGTGFALGDKVCALVAGGGYAEFCVVDAGHCLPIPAGLGYVEAAGLPETFLRFGAMCLIVQG